MNLAWRGDARSWARTRTGVTTEFGKKFMGGCMSIFGIPFFVIGFTVTAKITGSFFDGKTPLGVTLFSAGFGFIFALVGGVMIFGGVRGMVSNTSMSASNVKRMATVDTSNYSQFFPRLKNPQRGQRGVVLPGASEAMNSIVGSLIITAIWNGITWIGVYATIIKNEKHQIGLLIFLGIFALIGAAMIWGVIRLIARRAITGGTIVEVRTEPVRTGDEMKLFVSTSRDLQISDATIELRCIEKTTSGSGEDSTTHREVVRTDQLFVAQNFSARANSSFAEISYRMPADAIVSFVASDNSIQWEISVKMKVEGRPDIDDVVALRVAPGAAR
ncbi:MAG: hypothetical protein ABI579_05985 [Candidatus Sumerlaeota bacterium]